MKLQKILGAAAFVAVGAFAALPASANLITIAGGGTIECNGALANQCQGISGGSVDVTNPGNAATGGTQGALGSTADRYSIGNASAGNETNALNILAGTSFLESDSNKSGSNPPTSFNTLAEYIMLKIGSTSVFIRNLTGGSLSIVYNEAQGTGGGLSHTDEWGGSEVPLPAAIWLFGAGIAGLGFAKRKKKAA